MEPDDHERKRSSFQSCIAYQSLISDWGIILILFIIGITLSSGAIKPYHQCIAGWSTVSNGDTITYLCGEQQDTTLQHPYKASTISNLLALLLDFGPWLLTFVINSVMLYCSHPSIYEHRAVWKNIEIGLRMLLFASFSTYVVTTIIKLNVGRPRPNFYALAAEDEEQAFMSFPSGHSSSSFSVLFLLTLNLYSAMNYVQIRFKQHDKNTLTVSINNAHSFFFLQIWWLLRQHLLLSALLISLPTCLAAYIASTRLTDHWHHYADVVAGSLLGAAGASASFMIYRLELYPYDDKIYAQKMTFTEFDEAVEKEYEIQQRKPKYRSGGSTNYVLTINETNSTVLSHDEDDVINDETMQQQNILTTDNSTDDPTIS